jgi:hypothetical protein|tara:strand:+ start:36278 stop:36685 length:408 start_codon:yes stop_codon:yes gene_type:complete
MAHQAGTFKASRGGRLAAKNKGSSERAVITHEYAGPATYKDATGSDAWQETIGELEHVDTVVSCEIRLKYDGSGDDASEAVQVAGTQYRAHIIAVSIAAGEKNLLTIMVTTLAGVQVSDGVDLSTYALTVTVEGV